MFSQPRIRGLNHKRRNQLAERVNQLIHDGENAGDGTAGVPETSGRPLQASRVAFSARATVGNQALQYQKFFALAGGNPRLPQDFTLLRRGEFRGVPKREPRNAPSFQPSAVVDYRPAR